MKISRETYTATRDFFRTWWKTFNDLTHDPDSEQGPTNTHLGYDLVITDEPTFPDQNPFGRKILGGAVKAVGLTLISRLVYPDHVELIIEDAIETEF